MPDAAALTDETDALGPIQPPAPPNNADITPLLNQAKTNLGTSQQRMGPLLQQREQALGDVGGATQQYQQAAQGIPKPPQQQAPPNGGIDLNNASMWLMGATVLGAIAGSLTRRHVTNSLAAFTGALQGLKEGNQIKFERETKVWEEQNRLADQQYKYARDAYQSILENKKFDITTKSYMVEQTAMQIKDEQMQQAAAQRDIITMTGLMDARQREYDKSLQGFRATKQQLDRLEETKRHNQVQEGQGNEQSNQSRAEAIAKYQLPPIANPRNPQDRALMGQVMQINPDYDATQYAGDVSGARSTGTRLANLENISRSVNALVPQALAASAAVSRTGFVPVDRAIQMAQAATSTPELEAFATVNLNLAEQWARSQKPTGVLDVELQKLALGRLSTAKSDAAYRTVVNQIVESIQRETKAASAQRNKEPMTRPQVPGAFVPPGSGQEGAPAQLQQQGGTERKTLNGKTYYKQNGQWFEDDNANPGDRS